MMARSISFLLTTLMAIASFAPAAEGLAEGFTPIFDGASFQGWKWHEGLKGRWEIAESGIIRLREDQPPREGGRDYNLWSEKSYRDFILRVDWRLTGKPALLEMNDFTPDGLFKRNKEGKVVKHKIEHAGDSGIYLRGDPRVQVNIWSQPMGSGDINPYHKDASLPAEIRQATMPRTNADKPAGDWNRFIISLRGDRISVVLNGQTVIEQAQLPGAPEAGPIALQNHGDPIEFRNLYIKELE